MANGRIIPLLQAAGNQGQAQRMVETRFQVALKMRNSTERMLAAESVALEENHGCSEAQSAPWLFEVRQRIA